MFSMIQHVTRYLLVVLFIGYIQPVFAQTNYTVQFDGTDDYIEVANTADHRMTSAVTVEAWIYPTANTAYAGIANNVWHTGIEQSGYGLLMGGSSTNEYVYFVIATATEIKYLYTTIPSLNAWTHVAGTYDGTNMKIYVNGTESVSYGMSGDIQYTFINQFRIGRYFDDGEEVYQYTGYIDDVRLWNVARTQTQIDQYKDQYLSGSESNLVGYWKFDEGSGTTAQDATTNDHDGTLHNGVAYYENSPMPVELVSFTAIPKGRGIELAWKTATEVNNHGFDVEKRMKDELGIMNWEKIGFVEGNGTTNTPKSYTFVDGSASGTVVYRLKQIDRDGSFEYSNQIEVTVAAPKVFALMQNHPNPFNPTTSINYTLPVSGHVSLKIYDMLGKEVVTLVNGVQDAGVKIAQFNASQLPSGIYFYTLRTNTFSATKKMLLVK